MLAQNLTELNHRNSNGISVFLLWDSQTGDTFISVCDEHEDSEFMYPVSAEKAADAFRHPYAYLIAHETALYPTEGLPQAMH